MKIDESRIELKALLIDDAPVIRNLMQLYVYDLSEVEAFDVNDHGLFRYRYLDHYWTDENREAFIIQVDGKSAGFVLVNDHTCSPEAELSIAEFFTMRKYRRQGVGLWAAHQIFDKHPRCWEVRQTKKNTGAQRFWRAVLAAYNGNAVKDYPQGIGETDRPMQTVQSRTRD